jgi:hypothetical protein
LLILPFEIRKTAEIKSSYGVIDRLIYREVARDALAGLVAPDESDPLMVQNGGSG